MPARFYNTLTQEVEALTPLVPGEVSLYVCGMTTYDLPHAGHGRTFTAFDVLQRFLQERGYRVRYCRNVTDIDDKIIHRARDLGEEPLALSKRMSEAADADLAAIGCARPSIEPRVSSSIPDIVALIEELLAKEQAYVAPTAEGTDVYFSVRSFPTYGRLSRRNLEDLRTGASERLAHGATDIKRDPLDFALWKAAGDGFGWESPWGKGRPGWHIECSAMALRHLGEHIDIHCGGMDLIFPHHENEIAQSEAARGPTFARMWLHSGFLEIDKEKMSKSLGNFVTLRDLLARNDPEAIRYFFLGTHYRGPLTFDVDKRGERVHFPGVDEAEGRIDYLYTTYDALIHAAQGAEPAGAAEDVLAEPRRVVAEAREHVLEALDRDLNTPVALSVLAELAKAANEVVMQAPRLKKDPAKLRSVQSLAALAARTLLEACKPLGLMQASSEAYWERTRERRLALRGLEASAIDDKIAARSAARQARDFTRADALRAELEGLHVEVLDSSMSSRWRVRP